MKSAISYGLALICSSVFLATGHAQQADKQRDGVQVGEASNWRKLVSSGEVEKLAAQRYAELLKEARSQGALATPENAQLMRLHKIANRIMPFTPKFNPRAGQWQWEVNYIIAPKVNAFCSAGGKIVFYSGLVEGLNLTDDEIAVAMGHEIAHALREHSRAQIAREAANQRTTDLVTQFSGGASQGKLKADKLIGLKHSRDNETEADTVGLDLAARAGYDPRAGISLWRKMLAANKVAPLEFFSTHPAGENRIKEIESHLPEVMPLYRASKKRYQ